MKKKKKASGQRVSAENRLQFKDNESYLWKQENSKNSLGGQYFPGEWLVEALTEDTEIQNTPTTGVKGMQTKSVSGKYKTRLGGSSRWDQGCT